MPGIPIKTMTRHAQLLGGGLILLSMGLAGCRKTESEVVIDETRPLTSADHAPKLDATSKERFQGRSHAPSARLSYRGTTPEGWRETPSTPIRLLNYVIGPDGRGEVYLSQTRGGILGNVERWHGQFGIANTVGEDLLKMDRVPIMGTGEGLLVEARGTYSPGMGRPAEPGFALMGVIGVLEGGAILTVKMTGPEAVVKEERTRFLEFCRTLQAAE